MALLLVLLTAILAFSLASTDQCVSSPGSSIDFSLRSHRNASGHWIITVDTRRLTRKDNPREFSVNVQHETKICGRYEIEEHVSMAFVHPSLHDTSMPGAIEPSTTTTAATSSTAALSTTTATSPNATTTTPSNIPMSCPHSGYQLYPGYNCYKAFPSSGERKTWSEARQQCRRDGGDLMVIDSERERENVYVPLWNSARWDFFKRFPWVGVYIPQDENDWTTVIGQPALSTWWRPGEPDGDAARKCAQADSTGLLWNFKCTDSTPFICEISL